MSAIDHAFRQMSRSQFMPLSVRALAGVDAPQPIGYGQTISQPSLVRQMLEWLDVKPGDHVLDIGSGSGWTTALLSVLVEKSGHVYAVEIVPELVEFGRKNCQKAGATNVTFHRAGSALGLPMHAPFDRILVSAALDSGDIPRELIDQLRPDGKLVLPIGSDIIEATKRSDGALETTVYSGFAFVPLITDQDR